MKFTEQSITHTDRGTSTSMWFPESLDVEDDNEHIEIIVDGETRVALSSLVRLTETFTKQRELRTRLGHDCGVFAYAWESGRSLEDTAFHLPGASGLGLRDISDITEAPSELCNVQPGEIVFTEYAKPEDDDFLRAVPHFLVRATVDEGRPLYMSKLGPSGPVALSTLEQSMEFYPTRTMGIAKGFYEAIAAPTVNADNSLES